MSADLGHTGGMMLLLPTNAGEGGEAKQHVEACPNFDKVRGNRTQKKRPAECSKCWSEKRKGMSSDRGSRTAVCVLLDSRVRGNDAGVYVLLDPRLRGDDVCFYYGIS